MILGQSASQFITFGAYSPSRLQPKVADVLQCAPTEPPQLHAACGHVYGLRFVSLIDNVRGCSESPARKTTQKLIPGLLAAKHSG